MMAAMKIRQYKATLSYICCIVLLNALFVKLPGFTPFGDTVSAADLAVGAIYLVRDLAQREIGHYILLAMAIGTAMSYLLADSTIAMASAMAFLVGEAMDWLLFTLTRRPLSQRLLLSSCLSVPVDTWVFLYCADRLNPSSMSLMIIGKMIGVWILWLSWRHKNQHQLA